MSAAAEVRLLGLRLSNVRLADAATATVADAAAGRRRRVYFVNAHCVNTAFADADYLRCLEAADRLYADGSGVRWAVRQTGQQLVDNVNGTDLFVPLCEAAARAGVPIALLGARPGVAERCAQAMRQRVPGLAVAWTGDGFAPGGDWSAAIAGLNGSGARLLFVAMGVPRQERWIDRHAADLKVPVVLGVGALFDFFSGDVRRAPAWVRRAGLEWLFRLALEPRRLFMRYVVGNPLFVWRIWRARRARGDRLVQGPLRAGPGGPVA